MHVKNNFKFILIILLVFVVVIINVTCRYIGQYDELWNFMNLTKIHNDFSDLYNEANVIITPLFFFICNIILKVFGLNILVFRIIGVFIKLAIFMCFYNIFKVFINEKLKSITFASLLQFVVIRIENGANYNDLVFLFILLGILFYLKENNDKYITQILHGIIIYLIFTTKQNMGVYYIFATIIIDFIINKDKLLALKKLVIKGLTFILLVTLSVFVLHSQGMLYNLINYCFLGLKEFSMYELKNEYGLKAVSFIIVVLSIFILEIIYLKKNNKNSREYIILTVISIAGFGYMYPIFNSYHIYMGFLIFGILTILLLLDIFKELFNDKVYIFIYILTLIIYVIYFAYILGQVFAARDDFYTGNIKEFRYTFIKNEDKQKMYNINEYIAKSKNDGKSIKMFNVDAPYYVVVSKESNGIYDLPLVGNFGYKNEKDLLNSIVYQHDTYWIISKVEDIFSQESEYILSYIRENYNKVDEICNFEVYYIN